MRDTRFRAVYIWLGVRVFLLVGCGAFVGSFSIDGSPDLVQLLRYLLGVVAFLWVVAIAAMLVLLDVRVVRETLLLANLGISSAGILRVALPPIVGLETVLQVVGFFLVGS